MKVYLQCESGISGNMMVGALLDMGVPFSFLQEELKKLRLDGYRLVEEKKEKQNVRGTYFNVELDYGQCEKEPFSFHEHHEHHENHDHHHHHQHHHHHHPYFHEQENTDSGTVKKTPFPRRNYQEIKQIIEESTLSERVKEQSIAAFYALGMAEAEVHESTLEEVHFHEVGAVDCVVDIVGTMICLEYLGIKEIYVSPLHVGKGTVWCDHGKMNIPTPATEKLLQGRAVYVTDVKGELVTPTGAALVKVLCREDGLDNISLPMEAGGVGFGTMELPIPNVLKIYKIKG